jgi:Xaa-Pro dipeptidase
MKTRRGFLKLTATGAISALAGPATVRSQEPSNASRHSGNSAALLVTNPDHPIPATYDRLPLEWYKQTVKRLQVKLEALGLDGILIRDRWNIIYFTGLFHTTTERPFGCFIPTNELAVYWYHPGLDREIINSWWGKEPEYYFDYPHVEGGFPDKGEVVVGPPVDLLAWMLKEIGKRGFADGKIGLDQQPTVKESRHLNEVLPKAQFEPVDELCMRMRMVKTPEEIALTQRAMNYFSKIHAFARDYLLERGTDITDWQLGHAATQYGVEQIMKDVKTDGRPHRAVGVEVQIECRTGRATAYPHPNQFFHTRVSKGDAIQIAGQVTVGGYGGELYSPCQIAPWDSLREKMWEVQAESSAMQVRLSKSGTPCQEIAKAVHEYQVKQGMQKYLVQRVAHGSGMEGHQPPYIALGDQTVLEPGMMFSMEPGLFNPEGGYGYNPSDNVLVTADKGVAMGSLPLTKEWCFIRL